MLLCDRDQRAADLLARHGSRPARLDVSGRGRAWQRTPHVGQRWSNESSASASRTQPPAASLHGGGRARSLRLAADGTDPLDRIRDRYDVPPAELCAGMDWALPCVLLGDSVFPGRRAAV